MWNLTRHSLPQGSGAPPVFPPTRRLLRPLARLMLRLEHDMSVSFSKRPSAALVAKVPAATAQSTQKTRVSGHVRAAPPTVSLDQPGLLSVANVMAILAVKSPTTITTMVRAHRFPPPTMKIGRHPRWHTSVVRDFLEGQALQSVAVPYTAV